MRSGAESGPLRGLQLETARVLDVGNCDPDYAAIRVMIEANFAARLDHVMFIEEACDALRRSPYDLVLVNRLIFADQSEGTQLVRAMKRDGLAPDTPVLLISNYTDAQERARAEGAEPGFGKAALHDPETLERLAAFLPRKAATA
jgi:CheY-like chemotaxis protein